MNLDIRHVALMNIRAGAWPEAIAHMLERKALRDPRWALYDFMSRERAKLVRDPAQLLIQFHLMEREFAVGARRKRSTVLLAARPDISHELICAIAQARANGMQIVITAPDLAAFEAIPELARNQFAERLDCEALRAELDPPLPLRPGRQEGRRAGSGDGGSACRGAQRGTTRSGNLWIVRKTPYGEFHLSC